MGKELKELNENKNIMQYMNQYSLCSLLDISSIFSFALKTNTEAGIIKATGKNLSNHPVLTYCRRLHNLDICRDSKLDDDNNENIITSIDINNIR